MSARDILFGGSGGGSKLSDLGLALLRVTAGLAMNVLHGVDKLHHPEKAIGYARGMDLPAPTFFGWTATLAEFLGGFLLALGLLTRPSALLVGCTMFFAAFVALSGEGFKARELSLLYLAITVLFLFTGSGRYGVDALLRRRRGREE